MHTVHNIIKLCIHNIIKLNYVVMSRMLTIWPAWRAHPAHRKLFSVRAGETGAIRENAELCAIVGGTFYFVRLWTIVFVRFLCKDYFFNTHGKEARQVLNIC